MEKNNFRFFIFNLCFDIIMVGLLFVLSLQQDFSPYENLFLNIIIISAMIPVFSLFYFEKRISQGKKLFYSIIGTALLIVLLMFFTVKLNSGWFIGSVIALIILNVLKRIFIRTVEYREERSKIDFRSSKFNIQAIFIVILATGILIGFFTKAVIATLIVGTTIIGFILFNYVYKRALIVNKDVFLYGTITSLSSYLIVSGLLLFDYMKLLTIVPIIITFWLVDKTLNLF